MPLRLAAAACCVLALACGSQQTAEMPAGAAPSPVSAPPLAPATSAPFGFPEVFVGAGDIAMCDRNSEATARLLDSTNGTVFTLGDNAYPDGTVQQFRDCYDPTWGRHRSRTRPVPGNHDYHSPGAVPYFDYFGANAGPAGAGYYSYDLGAWHIVALNSNVAIASQAEWLRADLRAHPTACTLAYWHHPLYTSGPDGSTPAVRAFWRVLYDADADLVLNGHEHMFERFAPQDADGRPDPVRGIRQIIAGTGGASLYQPVSLQPSSEIRLSEFGVLKLTLSATGYAWDFLPVSGAGDSGSGTCH